MPRICPLNSGERSRFAAHQIADAIVGVQQIAVDLRTIDPVRRETRTAQVDRRRASTVKRSSSHLPIEVDALPIEPRRCTGLQSAVLEADRLERLCELARRRLAGASRRVLLRPDVNEAVQKSAGGDDQRRARVGVAVFHRQADDASVLNEHATGLAEQPLDVRFCIERRDGPKRRRRFLSACARGDQTAGPRLRFSSLN